MSDISVPSFSINERRSKKKEKESSESEELFKDARQRSDMSGFMDRMRWPLNENGLRSSPLWVKQSHRWQKEAN